MIACQNFNHQWNKGRQAMPVTGRGNVHSDYRWIAQGLQAIGQPQAELARALGWDQPTMSRQLKGKRELKAKEVRVIQKFFADRGLVVPQEATSQNPNLAVTAHTIPSAPQSGADKFDIAMALLDELREAVSDLRSRVRTLENQGREAIESPRGARRR
jgi:hypothetical protein